MYADPKKVVLPLLSYFDDFECGNPLASHAGEEKFGGIYVSVACLPPHMISSSKNIFLSTLVHTKYLKIFGNAAIFKKLINDLNDLSQNGITIKVNGTNTKVYFECPLV